MLLCGCSCGCGSGCVVPPGEQIDEYLLSLLTCCSAVLLLRLALMLSSFLSHALDLSLSHRAALADDKQTMAHGSMTMTYDIHDSMTALCMDGWTRLI